MTDTEMSYEERVATYPPVLPFAELQNEFVSRLVVEAVATEAQIAKLIKPVSRQEIYGALVKISETYLMDDVAFEFDAEKNRKMCRDRDPKKIARARLIKFVDDPFLATLPTNAPRAVKAIYRKEVMLKYMRCGDGSPYFQDRDAAEQAWAKWFGITDSESAARYLDLAPEGAVVVSGTDGSIRISWDGRRSASDDNCWLGPDTYVTCSSKAL